MQLTCTQTFENTADVYYDRLSDEEYAIRFKKHREENLPGIPSKFRYRQIVSMGGSRSSKSYSILQMLMLELIRRKGIKITCWRSIKAVCKSTIMEDFQKIIMFDNKIFKNFKENKQSSTFTYIPTGSKIVFTGADDIGKVLGGAQDISFFNEVTEFNRDVYLQITQRTSDRVICDYNPSKDFWLESYRYDENSVFIHSTFKDNSYCPVEIVKQLLSYEPWEPGSYEVRGTEVYYQGLPVTKDHQPPPHAVNVKRGTAHPFNWLVYGLGIGSEKPDRIYYGWRKCSLQDYLDLEYTEYFGLDFGSSNPTACMGVKYDGNGTFYIHKKLYKSISSLQDNVPTTLKNLVPEIKPSSMVVCDSAKQAYIDALRNNGYFAIPAKKGSGSVSNGIITVQKFNIVYVDDKDLNGEYTNYSWQLDRYGKATDEPIKSDDHLMDALRYIITYLVGYLNIRL
jgi:PBSX family phage terminase large subunit